MVVSVSVHLKNYWSYSALFWCCCHCGLVVLDTCTTGNCTFNSNILRHHLSLARSTERCSHLPFGRKILEGLLCFFSFPEWMLRYFNNKNIIFLHATHARMSEEAAEMSFWFQPTRADSVDWQWSYFLFFYRESFAMLIKRNGPIIYFYIFEGSFKNETELKTRIIFTYS